MLNYDIDNKCPIKLDLRHCKSRFFLIVEQKLAFLSSISLVGEIKNLSLNFTRIAQQFFTL